MLNTKNSMKIFLVQALYFFMKNHRKNYETRIYLSSKYLSKNI